MTREGALCLLVAHFHGTARLAEWAAHVLQLLAMSRTCHARSRRAPSKGFLTHSSACLKFSASYSLQPFSPPMRHMNLRCGQIFLPCSTNQTREIKDASSRASFFHSASA